MGEPSTFGRRLRAFRELAGLSQNELAARSGVLRPTISFLESGQQLDTSLSNATRLARALGISLDLLALGTGLNDEEDEAHSRGAVSAI